MGEDTAGNFLLLLALLLLVIHVYRIRRVRRALTAASHELDACLRRARIPFVELCGRRSFRYLSTRQMRDRVLRKIRRLRRAGIFVDPPQVPGS